MMINLINYMPIFDRVLLHRMSSLVQMVQSSSGGPPPGLVSAEPLADCGLRCFPEWASEKSTLCCGSGTIPGSENTALRRCGEPVRQTFLDDPYD